MFLAKCQFTTLVDIQGQVQVQAMALPDPTLPEVAVKLGILRLMAQMMAQKSQHQDQALRDNPIKVIIIMVLILACLERKS